MGRFLMVSLSLIFGVNSLARAQERNEQARAFFTPPAGPHAAFLAPPQPAFLPASRPPAAQEGAYRVNLRLSARNAAAGARFLVSQEPHEGSVSLNAEPHSEAEPLQRLERTENFRWGPALRQSFLFLAVQHGYALTQPKTRRDLKGPFLRDYFRSVKNLRSWADGGRFFTNYVAHPMQGSLTGFIQVQNDPRGMRERFGGSRKYWMSRLKAAAWTAAFSTQFEIGPISQASIGNVGKHGKQTYVDLIITPTAGTAWLIVEDALDRFVVAKIEGASKNFYLKLGARLLLNPTRSCANLLRFKKPWHRDVPR